MKRYDFYCSVAGYMHEQPDGEYVVYDDAQAEIERLHLKLSNRHETDCHSNGSPSFPCNCDALTYCRHQALYSDGKCMDCRKTPTVKP